MTTWTGLELSELKKDLPFALLAFVFWGAWAYYANSEAGFSVAWVSALSQGLFSMMMTFFIGFVTVALFHRFASPLTQLLMPSLLVLMMTSVCLSLLHVAIGTPELLLTISPALAVGYLFSLFKTIQIKKGGSHE